MSNFKALNSSERRVVWDQFSRVAKQGPYYTVKCNLCNKDEEFFQGRLKTLRYHLWSKHNDFYIEKLGDEPQHSSATSSVSTLSSSAAVSNDSSLSSVTASQPETCKKRNVIESWAERPLTKKEIDVFENRLIEMVADCNMPFAWIERKSTKRFLAACRPTILKHLPSRKRLSGVILKRAASASVESILPKVILLLALGIFAKRN